MITAANTIKPDDTLALVPKTVEISTQAYHSFDATVDTVAGAGASAPAAGAGAAPGISAADTASAVAVVAAGTCTQQGQNVLKVSITKM